MFSPWCDSEPFILDVDNRSIVAIWIALFTSRFVGAREGFHMSCLSCSGLALWFIKGCGKTGSWVFTGIVSSGRKKNSDKTYPTSQETLWFPGKLVRIVPQRREEHSWSHDLSYFVKLWSKRWLVDGEAVLPLIPLPVPGSIPRNAPSRARVWLPPVFLSFFKLSKPNPLSTSNLALSSFTPIQLIVDTLLERHISSLWQWLVILGFDVRVLLDEGDIMGTGEGGWRRKRDDWCVHGSSYKTRTWPVLILTPCGPSVQRLNNNQPRDWCKEKAPIWNGECLLEERCGVAIHTLFGLGAEFSS